MDQPVPPTLLLADDDPPSLRLPSRCLRDAGYATIECDCGRDALRQAVTLRPDLAILDINMPDLTGTEVARQIQAEAGIPFIFLSAHDESAIVSQAVAAGALGYLVKPVELPRIVPTVQAALSRASEIQRLRTSEANLSTALAVGRETSIAIGILMERHHLSQESAFEALRTHARTGRRKLSDVAAEIVAAAESLNAPLHRERDLP
jgi:response regulator NasT